VHRAADGSRSFERERSLPHSGSLLSVRSDGSCLIALAIADLAEEMLPAKNAWLVS
jgi:hypothetical protein